MFSRAVYPHNFYQGGYDELEALAEDLEYRASLVRRAARGQSRRPASVYEPTSQYRNSTRQPYYEPAPYRRLYPQYDYESEVPPQAYTYEAHPEYQEYYGYEYPAERHVVRRPSLYAPNDAFYAPDDAYTGPSPARRVAPHIPYVSPPRPRRLQAEFTEPEPRRPPEISLVAISPQRTTQSSPARHSTPVIAGLQRPAHLIPEERDADHFRHVPAAPQPAASGESDLEAPLRQVLEKSGPAEQRSSARNEPQASANSFQDFISQIADLVLGQQPQPNSQPVVSNQRQEAAAQSEPVIHVQFAPQPQTELKPQTQSEAQKVRKSAWRLIPPKTVDSLDPFHYQATDPTPETSYTYAAPASAQRGAIPKPAKVSGSPALPVPGRTFQHISANPRDPGAQPKPGAADEVAEIMEAIRRSLDRNEHVKTTSSAATPAPVQAPAVVASSPNAVAAAVPVRASPPATSTDSASVAVTSIGGIEERFVNLTYDFKFPSSPDFPDPATLGTSPLTAVPELLHTHVNQPIRAYENALMELLTELDAVDSDGDDEVRHERKELVNRIERELEKLETLKNEAWQRVISSVFPVLGEFAKAVESAAATDAFPVADAGAGANSEVASQCAGAEGTGVEELIQAEDQGASHSRRASEPITSPYPVATRARQSSSPPNNQDLPTLQTGEEIDPKSLGSSPVEVPSELSSEFGDKAWSQGQDRHQAEDEVPPSMEESALLERKTEFVLL